MIVFPSSINKRSSNAHSASHMQKQAMIEKATTATVELCALNFDDPKNPLDIRNMPDTDAGMADAKTKCNRKSLYNGSALSIMKYGMNPVSANIDMYGHLHDRIITTTGGTIRKMILRINGILK